MHIKWKNILNKNKSTPGPPMEELEKVSNKLDEGVCNPILGTTISTSH
jgi:hypothetical protein